MKKSEIGPKWTKVICGRQDSCPIQGSALQRGALCHGKACPKLRAELLTHRPELRQLAVHNLRTRHRAIVDALRSTRQREQRLVLLALVGGHPNRGGRWHLRAWLPLRTEGERSTCAKGDTRNRSQRNVNRRRYHRDRAPSGDVNAGKFDATASLRQVNPQIRARSGLRTATHLPESVTPLRPFAIVRCGLWLMCTTKTV